MAKGNLKSSSPFKAHGRMIVPGPRAREYPVDRDGVEPSFGSCESATTSRTSSPPPKNHPRSLPNDAAVDTRMHTPRHPRHRSAPSATPSSPTSSVFGRTHLVTTARRAQQQQQSTRESTHLPVVVADGPFRNAVLADVVGIRTRTPRHCTQGAQQQKKTSASRDNAPP